MSTYRQPFERDWPITQQYGEVVPGVTYKGAPHTGIDYGCPEGTPILASAEGTVVFANWDTFGYGNCVILSHPDGKATLYAHLSKILVRLQQQVSQGDALGLSGSTGNATGPHLHFEARSIWYDYKSHKDPVTFLPLRSVDDTTSAQQKPAKRRLKGADEFMAGDLVKVQNGIGVKAFHDTGFSYDRMSQYQLGTPFYFTGDTIVRKDNGLTYMRVVPALFSVWIAVNDGETQLLDT